MISWIWSITGISVCMLLSSFFSSSETALTSLPHSRIEQLLEKYPRWAKNLKLWLARPTEVLTTILIGNNLVNITASALATDLASQYFSSNGIPIAIGGMTLLLLIAGEIVPKVGARMFAEAWAPAQMHVLVLFYGLFFPFTWFFMLAMRRFLPLSGAAGQPYAQVTEEDIAYAVKMGGQQGMLDQQTQSLFDAVLKFSDTTTREIMSPRTDMVCLAVSISHQELLEQLEKSGLSRFPVFEGSRDNIVGIFHSKDLIQHNLDLAKPEWLRPLLRQPLYVPEAKKISEVFQLFQQKRAHMAIVVDEFGGTSGLVTLEDIMEELMGEIRDEFDAKEPDQFTKTGDHTYLADARVNIVTLIQFLKISFPEDRTYESLGGFLLEEAGEVPPHRWQCEHDGFVFRVLERNTQRVIKVGIEAPKSAEGMQTRTEPMEILAEGETSKPS